MGVATFSPSRSAEAASEGEVRIPVAGVTVRSSGIVNPVLVVGLLGTGGVLAGVWTASVSLTLTPRPGVSASAKARAKSAVLRKRSCGFFANAFLIAKGSCTGRSVRKLSGGVGGSLVCLVINANGVSASNGIRPVTIT
jgi:hypothetical protein